MRIKGDIEIGYRAFEETMRVFCSPKNAMMALSCSKNMLYGWKEGSTPNSFILARLHYAGADVIYILTGKQKGAEK